MKPGVVIYTRVSTLEQVKHGVSMEAQLAQATAYASFKGFEVIEHIQDRGVSGSVKLSQRPGGARLVELVQRDDVQAVIAYKLDRLFRDASDCLAVTKDWDEAGAALHLVDIGGQPVDTSTAMGRFFLTVMAGVAEMERSLLIERTKSAMDQLKASNKRAGSIPYGYGLADDGETLIEDETEQRIVRAAMRLHKQGVSFTAIGKRLAKRKLYTRSGRPFQAVQVQRLIKRAKDSKG